MGDLFTYTLVGGIGAVDNALFNISGATLQADASFDFESRANYFVRIRSTDQLGEFTEKAFSIQVVN
ncbi:MAG: cadherin repeat domain-containing protein, partial [Pirellulaceae bacterium]